jgi:actin-like ATPase involved in cell morphogenesis
VGYRLGVDLGTTYTAAAISAGGRVDLLGLGIRAMQVPSVVFVRADGELVVGEAAEQQGAADPTRVVREFKRRLGDPVPLVVGGSPFSAQALTARLLAWVVGVASERQGGPPEHVCVTYPANWGPFKRDLLGQAIELAGLGGVETSTCTEPEAAATAYASRDRVAEGDRVAVYDLGGGTFDAAVLQREGAGFRLLGRPEGVEHLGGIDFDEAVFRHVLSSLGPDVADLDDTDPMTAMGLARLRRDCVEAKEMLSSSVDTVVPATLPGINRPVRLTRGEFEDMARPAIGETVAAMRRVLESAEVQPSDVSAIVLVGGSSRIPLVSEMLSAAFGRPLALDTHPKHDIATGAAIRGTAVTQASATQHTSGSTQAEAQPVATATAMSSPAVEAPAVEAPAVEAPVADAPVADAPAAPAAEDLVASAAATTTADGAAADTSESGATVPAGPSPDWRPPATVGPMQVHSAGDGGTGGEGAVAQRRGRRWGPPALVGTLLVIIAATAVVVAPLWTAEQVHREAVTSLGAQPPFIPSNGSPGEPQAPVPTVVNTSTVTGDTPGLYGGTRDAACDARAIRSYLEANPDKAGAWATVLGLSAAEIGPFLESLTPLTLRTDTAITNHGFEGGRATPFQSVLQAGTAVLVDPGGLPRVRCYCGNPLNEPDQPMRKRYTGSEWEGFSGDSVKVIAKAPAEVREFVVVKPDTNEVVNRPRATRGEKDRAADPAVAKEVEEASLRRGAGKPSADPEPNAVDSAGGAGSDATADPQAGTGSAPSAAASIGTGAAPSAGPSAGAGPSIGAGPSAGTGPGSNVDPSTGTGQGADADPNAGTGPDAGGAPDPGARSGAGGAPDPGARSGAGGAPDPGARSGAGGDPDPGARSGAGGDPDPGARSGAGGDPDIPTAPGE